MRPSLMWAAGLFEGEGSLVEQGTGRWQFALSSTDFDVALAFAEVTGLGKLYGPYRPKNKRIDGGECKDYWKWVLSDAAGICAFVERFVPYMGARRSARMLKALDGVSQIKSRRLPHTRALRSNKLIWVAGEGRVDRHREEQS